MNKKILDFIGNTPLVQISFKIPLFAKLEFFNPGGSIKDRSAKFMIEKAEQNNLLKPNGTIIEASSGNQGIALAMIGSIKGYKVIITTSKKISSEKLNAIKAYGAKVIVCPETKSISDINNYHNKAKKLSKKIPNSFMPNQYFNLENPEAHYESLGPEIWKQTSGKITHLFAAAGTGGTISGAGKFLKEKNKNIKIIAVDSAKSYKATKGFPKQYKIEGMGIDFDSPCLNQNIIDKFINITDEEAESEVKILAEKFGLLVGGSSGAVFSAVKKFFNEKQMSNKEKKKQYVVMIFGDSGRAYLSKHKK